MPPYTFLPTPESIAYFSSIPWCKELLTSNLYTPVRTPTRDVKPTGKDSFFAETLQTHRTIRYALTLIVNPSPPHEIPSEILVLLDLGDGINGFPNISHGGFLAAVLDEVAGVLMDVRHRLVNKKPSMTGYLNVRYLRPVKTPCMVVARAKFKRVEGRKLWVDASVEDEEGRVYATAEAMFIELKEKL